MVIFDQNVFRLSRNALISLQIDCVAQVIFIARMYHPVYMYVPVIKGGTVG